MENYDDRFSSLRSNPSLVFILGFATIIFIGATLLNLPFSSANGKSIGFIDALFTATSATCVTGLVVVNTAESWSLFGKIVIIFLIQMGGLGVMTISTLVAFFLGRRISLKTRILIREERNTDDLEGVVRLTKHIIGCTFLIEFIGAVLFSFVFVKDYGIVEGIWFSFFHAISSFCNAGFDLIGDSMIGYVDNPIITFTVCMLIICGGIGFFVILEIYRYRNFKKLSLHSKLTLIITGILLMSGFILFFVFEYNNPETIGKLSMSGKIQASIFQSVTTRTAGYNSVRMEGMRMSTTAIFVLLMFVGGSSGSTAGGIKTTTAGVVFLSIYNLVRGKRDIEVFMKRIPYTLIFRSVAIIGIAFFVVFISSIVLTITESATGYDFLDILFEVVSAFGTVGLTRGLTPELSHIGRIIVSFVMFIGRVGPLTVAYALMQEQNKNLGSYTYPEGKVMVG